MRVEFSDLEIIRQYRNEIKPFIPKDIIAYDTETIQGQARLICDSKGDFCYPESFSDCIEFLTRRKNRDMMGWFYNLNHDAESLLKWLDIEHVKAFAPDSEITDYFVEHDQITIKIIKGKMLKITRDKHSFIFFDIANFYRGGLDKNAQKYLGEEKYAAPIDDWTKVTIADLRRIESLVYCKRDAWLTEKLAVNFIQTCNQFGIFTRNYCSPASLATHYFLSKVNIAPLSDLARGRSMRVKLAYEAYKGGFIQTFKRGYFEKIYLYDINSAYPFQIANLPNLKKGRFIFRIGQVPRSATHGWMRVKIHTKTKEPYSAMYYSPVATYLKKFNKNFYFAGSISATITLLEYEALKNDFTIEIGESIFWIPDGEIEYLYRDQVNYLYQLRQENKSDENLNLLLKTILNGYYGKLIQKIPKKDATEYEYKTGNLFNPFHASYITAGTRIQIYETIRKYGAADLVAVMTDAVAYTRPLDVPQSKRLGDWSLDLEGEGVFIGSGLYSLIQGEKIKTATRGFKLTSKLNFFNLLATNQTKNTIDLPQNVRLSYKEALRIKKFVDWNVIQQGLKSIDINCDTKRIWQREFSNCRDVLETWIDSEPIFVSM